MAIPRDRGYRGLSLTARKLTVVLATSVAAVLASGSSAAADLRKHDSQQRFIPGEALVRFEPGVVAAERREARADAGVAFEESLLLPRVQLVKFRGSVQAAVARLERQPGVAYAQPNFRYHALAAPPNDTHFGQLWGFGGTPGIGVLPAWDITRGAGQIIAVADTGVDLTHPDLQGNIWTGPGGIHGHDFVDDDTDPADFQYHGTHVAGTAAAIANNGQGVAGVAPEAQIMAVRVLDGDGGGGSGDIANGIAFAADNGASVVNMSLGGSGNPSPDTAMGQAVSYAADRGTMIVAAAGNDTNDNDASPVTPCSLPHNTLICVAALDDVGGLAGYSNFGATSVDVGAPGGDSSQGNGKEILSSKPAWVTKFNENFEDASDWTASGTWGTDGPVGSKFATDSPGGAPYTNNTNSDFVANAATALSGAGCRVSFEYEVQTADAGDILTVGVDTTSGLLALDFTGTDAGTVEASLSQLDGQSVTPTLQFTSNGSGVSQGGLVDEFRLACRGSAPSDYDNDVVDSALFDLSAGSGGGSYMAISGTSMATPHVAGVAALIRAADPGAPPAQVVQALKESVTPLGSLSGKTSTGGAVNALPAIQRALALPNPAPPPPPPPPPPAPPGKARFGSVSVNKRGVLTIRLRGDAGTAGVLTLSANITRATRVRTVGRKSFRIGSTGRAAVKVKLSRPALRQLRRTRRLRLRAKVVLRNAAGLRSTSSAGLRVRLRRR
jgi:thermitase